MADGPNDAVTRRTPSFQGPVLGAGRAPRTLQELEAPVSRSLHTKPPANGKAGSSWQRRGHEGGTRARAAGWEQCCAFRSRRPAREEGSVGESTGGQGMPGEAGAHLTPR